MKTVRESTTLYNFLGSHNSYWRLTESSDVLRFSTTETTEPERMLQLSAEQGVEFYSNLNAVDILYCRIVQVLSFFYGNLEFTLALCHHTRYK